MGPPPLSIKRAFDHVAELPNIARKGMSLQRLTSLPGSHVGALIPISAANIRRKCEANSGTSSSLSLNGGVVSV